VRALPEQGGKLLASDVGVTCHSVGSCDALQRYITVVADPIRAKLLDTAGENTLVLSLDSHSLGELMQIWAWGLGGQHKGVYGD
jgi:hypothetical protein